MPRALAAVLAAVAIVLAVPFASGAANRDVPGKITLRAQYRGGAWKKTLSIKLHKLNLTPFRLCAIWNHQAGAKFDCDGAEAGNTLPTGTNLRLEQNPIAKALKRTDSPGWGMLGASGDGALGAVLSNEVTGNKRGRFHYRVTLRDRSNHVLATSNVMTLTWR